jgi:hypothetical protein
VTARALLERHPDEFSVKLSLAQTLLTWAYSCYRSGELSKSVDIALEGIVVSQKLVEAKEELSEAWKLIGDAVFLGSLSLAKTHRHSGPSPTRTIPPPAKNS